MSVDHAVRHGTKRTAVLDLLWDLRWHDSFELVRVGGLRAGARVHELKRQGWDVEVDVDADTGRARYRLVSWDPGPVRQKKVKALLREDDVARLLATGELTASAISDLQAALDSFRANKEKL